MTFPSMAPVRRHLILNNAISSKVLSKSLRIYISKGEKTAFISLAVLKHAEITFISRLRGVKSLS